MNAVVPYIKAILLCDQVIVDGATQKKTLVGLFDRVNYLSLPVQQELTLFAKLTDAEGYYQFRVEYVHVSTDRVIANLGMGNASITDRLSGFDLIFRFPVQIEEQGLYELRLFANDVYLARATFEAIPVNASGG